MKVRAKVTKQAASTLTPAEFSKCKASALLSFGHCAEDADGVLRSLQHRLAVLSDPANRWREPLVRPLVRLAKEHVVLLRQPAPEAQRHRRAMIVEAVWSALLRAMAAKGYADKFPMDEPDLHERASIDGLCDLVNAAGHLVPLLGTPAVWGTITAPTVAALLGRPAGEPLPAHALAFDIVNGWAGLADILMGHLASVRELACALKIISRLPENFEPCAIADGLAKLRPLPELKGMLSFVTSRLEKAGAASELRQAVAADFAALQEPLRQLRADLCVGGAFSSGAQLAAHIDAQLSRRVDLRGTEVYSGGCCALKTMRLMVAVAVFKEIMAFELLAHPDRGLGGHMAPTCRLGKMWLAGVTSLAEAMKKSVFKINQNSEVQGLFCATSPLRCLQDGVYVIALLPNFMCCIKEAREELQNVDVELRKLLRERKTKLGALPAQELPPQADAPARKSRRDEAGGDGRVDDAADAAPPAEARLHEGAGGAYDDGDDGEAAVDAPARKRLRKAEQQGGKAHEVQPTAAHAAADMQRQLEFNEAYPPEVVKALHLLHAILPLTSPEILQQAMQAAGLDALPALGALPQTDAPARKRRRDEAGGDGDAGTAADAAPPAEARLRDGSGGAYGDDDAAADPQEHKRLRKAAGRQGDKAHEVLAPKAVAPVQPSAAHAEGCNDSDGAAAGASDGVSGGGGDAGGAAAANTHAADNAGPSRAGVGGGVRTRAASHAASGAVTPPGAACCVAPHGARAAAAAGGGAASAAAAQPTAAARGAAAPPLQADVRRGGPAAAATGGAAN